MITNLPVQWISSILGQAVDAGGGATSSDAVKVQSIWDFIVKGGPVMIPIGLCSFIALTIIVERMISLRRRQVAPPDLAESVGKLLGDDDRGRNSAIEHCQKNGSPLAIILTAAVKKIGEPVELLERHIQDAGERVVLGLRKNLRALSVIASIAPLMGLLGTIFGMINAFQTVATSGEALGRTELLAKGIYQAMITTAAGLLVAIPVLVAYHWLSAKVEGLVHDMDQMTVEFVEAHGVVAAPRTAAQPMLRRAVEEDDTDAETDEVAEPARTASA